MYDIKLCRRFMKRLAMMILPVILLVSILTPTLVFADDTIAASSQAAVSETVQQLLSKVATLPTEKTITIADKEAILEASDMYKTLTSAQDIVALGSSNISKINVAYQALMPLLLADVSEQIDALPKVSKIKQKNADAVTAAYSDYSHLTDDAKEAMSQDLVDKLLGAVKKIDPSLLAESNSTVSSVSSEDTSSVFATTVSVDSVFSNISIWEIVLIIVLSCLVLCNIGMIVLVMIRTLKQK